MNKMNWTPKQQEAIDTRNKNILVSAAAGSGKTAVLTQRIIDLITKENVDITSMLVLTFTNAAANEMSARIQKKMYEYLEENRNNKHIKKQISMVSGASISTMHSFCIDIIRENFNFSDIDPNFVIANAATVAMIKQESISEIFEEKYENQDEDFLLLTDIFSSRYDDSKLINIIYKIYNFIQSKKEPMAWLNEQVEKYNISSTDSEYFALIREDIATTLDDLIEKSETIYKMSITTSYEENIADDLEKLRYLRDIVLKKGYDDFVDEIKAFSLSRLKAKKKTDDVQVTDVIKDVRTNIIKKIIDKSLKKYTVKSDSYIKYMNKSYNAVRALCNIVAEFEKVYRQKKYEQNTFDFNDLEHFALDLLKNEEISAKVRKKYSYIFYDEYQDSNEVHDSIIESIAGEDNLFFVGDVKQSIYGFRLADPSIFIKKYEDYKENTENNAKIDLSSNFRSSRQILDFCNLIFENIMVKSTSDMDYDKDAMLRTTDTTPYDEKNIEINFVDKSNDEEDDKVEEMLLNSTDDDIMATLTAKQIVKMMEDDKSINFKDIVVLKRSFANGTSAYSKAFLQYNIPVFIDYQSSSFDVLEVSVFIDMLKIIDNIRQDLPLISTLMSGVGGFSIEEITKIKSSNLEEKFFHNVLFAYEREYEDELSAKIKKFRKKIEEYSKLQNYMRLDEFVDFVLIGSRYKDYVSSLTSGDMRLQNLSIVREKATEFMQNENKSLFNFLLYLDSILKNKSDRIEPQKVSENQNVVRIMSIHKSKGLEFPIVILNDIQKKFNMQDTKSEVIIDSNLGIGVDYVDVDENYYLPTLSKKCIIAKSKKNILSEEIRILYVALTRAKKKLILNGHVNSNLQKTRSYMGSGLFPKNLNTIDNYQDLILYAFRNDVEFFEENAEDIEKNRISSVNIVNIESLTDNILEKEDVKLKFYEMLNNISMTEEEKKALDEKYCFDYKYKDDVEKEIKINVTSLSKEKNKYRIEKLLTYSEYIDKSHFSPEKIGTLNHMFLQHIDFKKSYNLEDLKNQLVYMIDNEFITKEEAEVINLSRIYDFLESEFGQRIRNAQKIYKEESFVMNYDGSVLSGTVDLFFEEENHIVLVDYKTDHIPQYEMTNRASYYKSQLDLYKDAIQKAFGKKVSQSYIYFLSLGKYVEVK